MTAPKYLVDIHSDLYVAGHDEDGQEIHGETFFVRATDDEGNRFTHFQTFSSTGRWDRDVAVAKVERLEGRIIKAQADGLWAGPVGSPHWKETEPCYGSYAYSKNWQAYAARDELLDHSNDIPLERRQELEARAVIE